MGRFVWATPGPYDDDEGLAHAVEVAAPVGILPFIIRRITRDTHEQNRAVPAVVCAGVPALCGFNDDWAWANATHHTKRCEACQAALAAVLEAEAREDAATPATSARPARVAT